MQTEKSFQKQFGVTGGFKSKDKKAPGKSGHRYFKNVGLGFKTPKEAIEDRVTLAEQSQAGGFISIYYAAGTYIDKKCPFTGNVSIRGRILSGQRGNQLGHGPDRCMTISPSVDRCCQVH